MSEERLGRFTGWIRRRPSSLEFWELVLTTDRLLWCFAGETFTSALLRADMGESAREGIEGLSIDEIAEYDERNFEVPLDELSKLRLVDGTRFRRARLELSWDDETITLYSTKGSDSQREMIETLTTEPSLEGVSIEIDTFPSFFDRL